MPRQGHARRLHAARAPVRSEHPGPAPRRALPRRSPTASGSSTTTASSARTDGAAILARNHRRRRPRTSASPSPSTRATRDTAWFVPAIKDERRIPVDGRVVVTRTRDGGQTFDVLTGGLPQEHAYDLVYRHCLDIDATGDVLAFGSTTGSLWVTDDAGDSWQTVTTHLPPIYSVRFA